MSKDLLENIKVDGIIKKEAVGVSISMFSLVSVPSAINKWPQIAARSKTVST